MRKREPLIQGNLITNKKAYLKNKYCTGKESNSSFHDKQRDHPCLGNPHRKY